MESDFEFEYQMSLRLVHKLLSKVDMISYLWRATLVDKEGEESSSSEFCAASDLVAG